jgi:hypothetical protein
MARFRCDYFRLEAHIDSTKPEPHDTVHLQAEDCSRRNEAGGECQDGCTAYCRETESTQKHKGIPKECPRT